jgi:signal transduction histidine kinase
MKQFLPFIFLLLFVQNSMAQIDSAIEAKNTTWFRQHYDLLIQNPSNENIIDFLTNLTEHTLNSTVSLKELKFYLSEMEKFFIKHPEFNRSKYLLEFSRSVMEMYLGHPNRFHEIINETEIQLRNDKYYKELFHLNLLVCQFLPSVNLFPEAKSHFYENEKLISDLRHSGFNDFNKIQTVQHANTFGFLFLKMGELDSAEKYYKIGLQWANEKNDSIWIGIISGNLGVVLYRKGNFVEAEKLLKIDKRESLRSNQTTSAINAILTLIDIKLAEGNIFTSENYLKEAADLIEGFKINDEELMNYYFVERMNKMGHLYLLKGDKLKSAYYYDKAHLKIRELYKSKLLLMSNLNNKRFAFEENAHKIAELEENSKQRQNIIWFICLVLFSLFILVIIQRRFNQELRVKNQQIEKQSKILHDLNIQKSKLFSIVAHDMRSPFANLRNLIDLHKDNAIGDDEFLKFCVEINQSIHGLSGTFENIMSWAKVGMEKGIVAKNEPVSIATIINELNVQMASLLQAKSIKLNTEIVLEKEVMGDINLLFVVLRNLIHNAIKFSHMGGNISFIYEQDRSDERFAIFKVKDNGVGMESELLSTLFSLSNNRSLNGTSGERGSGLGLMICQEFVLAMNGSLNVESTLGEGSSFIVRLPLVS